MRRLVKLHFGMIQSQRARHATSLTRHGLIEFVADVVDEALGRHR